MAEIRVKVPNKAIEDATQKELAKLRRQTQSLKKQNDSLKHELGECEESVRKAKAIIEAVKEAGEFPDWNSL